MMYVYAQTLGHLVNSIVGGLIQPLILLFLVASFCYLVWSLTLYIFKIEKEEKGIPIKSRLLWSVIIFSFMVAIFSILYTIESAVFPTRYSFSHPATVTAIELDIDVIISGGIGGGYRDYRFFPDTSGCRLRGAHTDFWGDINETICRVITLLNDTILPLLFLLAVTAAFYYIVMLMRAISSEEKNVRKSRLLLVFFIIFFLFAFNAFLDVFLSIFGWERA